MRLDEPAGAVDSLLSGLLRATGRPAIDAAVGQAAPTPEIRFDSSLAYGDVFALDRLWHELGFNEIAGLLRSARLSFDAEALVRAMVFNRLCDATSKLGLLRWLQTTWLPGVDASEVTHQSQFRITGPSAPIVVWYSPQGEWLGLDSIVGGKHKLSYRL